MCHRKDKGWIFLTGQYPALCRIPVFIIYALALPYPEHLRAAGGTDALGRRFAILHDYTLGILHLPLGTALHAICLH